MLEGLGSAAPLSLLVTSNFFRELRKLLGQLEVPRVKYGQRKDERQARHDQGCDGHPLEPLGCVSRSLLDELLRLDVHMVPSLKKKYLHMVRTHGSSEKLSSSSQ